MQYQVPVVMRSRSLPLITEKFIEGAVHTPYSYMSMSSTLQYYVALFYKYCYSRLLQVL